MLVIEWKFALVIPTYDKVHEVLHAFLRTSEQGAWVVDETEPSDIFVLNYRRGQWRRSLYGFGRKLVPAYWHREDPKLAPMQLRVTIRPAPSELSISVYHKLYWRDGNVFRGKVRERCELLVARHVNSEVKALAGYLQKVYELPALPKFRET